MRSKLNSRLLFSALCLSLSLLVPNLADAAPAKKKGKESPGWSPPAVEIVLPPTPSDTLGSLKSGGKFGLGLLLGSRTGLSAKLWPGRRHSLSIDVGSTNFTNTLSFAASYHFYPKLIRAPQSGVSAQLYFGVGVRARLLIHSEFEDPNDSESATILETASVAGVRVPIGISFLLQGFPIELFIEAAPAIDFWYSLGFDLEGIGGARIYF
jgi:hypothetical protein